MKAPYDALIIGAGAAGLAALRELHGAGLRVACIEALDRIGGRIYTVHDPPSPAAIELGAEFVHGRAPEIFDLIEEAGLPVVERVHEIHRPGDATREPDNGGMWKVLSAMEEAAERGPDMSFADFAATAPFDNRAKHAATSYVEGFNAARAEIVGIHSLAQDSRAAEAIEGDRAFHLARGYDSVARALIPAGAELRLNTIAERIAWKHGEATVYLRSAIDGSRDTSHSETPDRDGFLGCAARWRDPIRSRAGGSDGGGALARLRTSHARHVALRAPARISSPRLPALR